MSIVYDYLKKIRDQKETTPAAAERAPVAPQNSRSFSLGKILAGVLGALVIVVGVYVTLPMIQKALAQRSRVLANPASTQPSVPDFNFLLEGIIYNPSKPFAIMDGKMYETGGRFGDYEITQITPDTVSLKNLKDQTSHTARL